MSAEPTTPIGIERAHAQYRTHLWVLAALSVLGLIAFFWRVAAAPTAETWGLLTANYVFLLGITQFGVAFSAIMRLCGGGWPAAFYRIGDLITLSFIPFALVGFLVIYFFGQEHLFYWLHEPQESPWLNINWLFVRNLFALVLFYALAVIYFINALRPDVHPDAAREGPPWRRTLYQRLLASETTRDPEQVRRRLHTLAILVLLAGALSQTFIGWDLGMMLYYHYHSSVFTLHVMMSNIFGGTAALLLIHAAVSRYVSTDAYVGVQHMHNMGSLLTGFTLLWLYMWWAQFFVSWFGNLDFHMVFVNAQMEGHYAPFFWTMMSFVFFIPLATLIFRWVKRTAWSLLLVAGFILVGIWIKHYLTVMPALSAEHVPFGSLAEIAITVGWIAAFGLVLLLTLQAFPAVARWENVPAAEASAHAQHG
jgi:hypothetical protein